MKIDRLIGILSVLLQKETTTAPQLAEQFEVSRRTINRDIEAGFRWRYQHHGRISHGSDDSDI